ncbi:MAG: hypothetical protein COX12_01085 [Candidatus Brennerbacteria bacterium CG23_combo_of_CG06-09_8_20_14_all_44_41]|uniref:DNA polymerase III subunit gamma/tau n=1 Tax=Candidatus Brennerbacteria bacterium CG_4_9_14_3_um_filter_43_9 TaxID=1974522 RepID=A0A2M8C308_9BACT|nr:MAG: DNA polymerase III, subunit gamma and tau [Parcubacteria group bacterium CG1_02_44_31]PIP50475.1 MAG: hypothetical protein COX12_01085 [Candidatus Brennerbacteria bacterium CG23_combo_of_CG06-09_8_20_14_all_44_41]PJB50464.1 MAG: hypothetical protein CO102_01055 [Candidatus Brennerbacteria bacterium CG_4_9_14_3_um_filter_43_9]
MADNIPLVFYRKYRPQRFADFVNQVPVRQTLQNAIILNKISHAYLFAGTRGTGKTTMARLFAKTINCLSPERNQGTKKPFIEPCNKCESCLDIERGRSIDLIEIDAASNRGIDDIRDLKENIRFSPVKTKYKVFIIDEAHMLTPPAFNALLKTLEEPPKHAILILVTTDAEKLPATILSRVQRFDFKRLPANDIAKRLEFIKTKEGINAEPQALHHISQLADGSIRDAESIFGQVVAFSADKTITLDEVEQIVGSIRFEKMQEFLFALAKNNVQESIQYINNAQNQGLQLYEVIRLATTILEKILVLKMDASFARDLEKEYSLEELETLKTLAQTFDAKKLQKLVREFLNFIPYIKKSILPSLPIELAIIETMSE